MENKSKDELIVWLKQQLELCSKESNRRDEKWMTGIEECCGCKINFSPLGSMGAAPSLDQYILGLKDEIQNQRDVLADIDLFLNELKEVQIFCAESMDIDNYLTKDVDLLKRKVSKTLYGENHAL